ncbi:MAG: recombinase family protein, partial [Planctomycetota bacterium]|nr:recombinase family protein [Planctomycetota bacterium]
MTKRRIKASPPLPETWRCAIYTRKSTTMGLEQEFNTLDAQREACERYVDSQAHLPAPPPRGPRARARRAGSFSAG